MFLNRARPRTRGSRTLGLIALAGIVIVLVAIAVFTRYAEANPSAPAPTRIAVGPGRFALPDHNPCIVDHPSPCIDTGIALFGTLREQGGCIWIVRDNGEEDRIVWPFGYSARVNPFAVFDNSGTLVAKDHDQLHADGEGPTTGEPDACGRRSYVVLNDPVR